MRNKYYFFWGGPFSQWALADMVINGVKYNCYEQYMMAKKAEMFEDTEIFEKILDEKDPKEQKAFGRKVKNFDKEVWESHAREIVYVGNYHKFRQSERCFEELERSRGQIIVEASPDDTIWGI